MSDGWYDAPREAARHAVGTKVVKPAVKNGCWATAERHTYNGRAAKPTARSCQLRARRNCLTCSPHNRLEPLARQLKQRLDAEADAKGAA